MNEDGYFDAGIAATYDESSAEMFATSAVDPAVDFLVERVGGGRALEFAIGTGRIALPLAARGVRVDGIDISPAMAAKLRAKEGGNCDCAKISTLTRSRSASMRSGSTLLATIR